MLGVEDWEEMIPVNTIKGVLYVQQLPLAMPRPSHPDLDDFQSFGTSVRGEKTPSSATECFGLFLAIP
jgi:hypothetical protein